MKILSAQQIRLADAFTIANEPIKSIDLMERAGNACFDWIGDNLETDEAHFHIFCGVGNNGGDGLVLARLLTENGQTVSVYLLKFSDQFSADFKTNLKRLEKKKVKIIELSDAKFEIDFDINDIVVDAIFGTGLSRPVKGWVKKAIQKINFLPLMRLSIDMPSGLFSEFNEDNDMEAVIMADVTLTFQNPKLAMVLEGSGKFCGDWDVLDIGLDEDFIESLDSTRNVLEEDDIWVSLKEREKYDHKGSFGHALIIAGSKGKIGAAVLSSRACLRSGIGLLTTLVPECGYDIIQTAVPEAMCLTSSGVDRLIDLPAVSAKFDTIGVGPGIGTDGQTIKFMRKVLAGRKDAMVLDADALNIISEHPELLKHLPKNSILTPHPGEFKRLAGEWTGDKSKLEKQVAFSVKHGVIVVLKGAHTSISCPDGRVFFNSTGNPGMATAGSGDALLGVITALLARGYGSIDAACIGVYVHGKAGDVAALEFGQESMKAGDIIESLPAAFKSLY